MHRRLSALQSMDMPDQVDRAVGDSEDAKSPATRRLFNGISIAANGCSTATPNIMQQQERTQSPGSGAAAAAAAASAGQAASMYRSAPASPHGINTGAGAFLVLTRCPLFLAISASGSVKDCITTQLGGRRHTHGGVNGTMCQSWHAI